MKNINIQFDGESVSGDNYPIQLYEALTMVLIKLLNETGHNIDELENHSIEPFDVDISFELNDDKTVKFDVVDLEINTLKSLLVALNTIIA